MGQVGGKHLRALRVQMLRVHKEIGVISVLPITEIPQENTRVLRQLLKFVENIRPIPGQ